MSYCRWLFAAGLVACVLKITHAGQDVSTETSSDSSVIVVRECQIHLADERELACSQGGILAQVQVREGDRVQRNMVVAELDASIPQAALAVASKQAENDVSVRFAQEAHELAKVKYQQARGANRKVQKTFSDLEMHELLLERNRSELEIEVSEHELAVNALKQEEAQVLVDAHRIVSPISGLVTDVVKSVGESAQAGEVLITVQNTDRVRLEARLHIQYLADVRPGSVAEVIPMFPRPGVKPPQGGITAQVYYVGVSAEPVSQTVLVKLEADNQTGLLIAGTDAVLQFSRQASDDVADSSSSESVSRD